MSNYVETAANRSVLKYAVQRAIFYPYCGHVADVRTAVLVDYTHEEHGQHVGLFHEQCIRYDALMEAMRTQPGIQAFEVLRGQDLFGRDN